MLKGTVVCGRPTQTHTLHSIVLGTISCLLWVWGGGGGGGGGGVYCASIIIVNWLDQHCQYQWNVWYELGLGMCLYMNRRMIQGNAYWQVHMWRILMKQQISKEKYAGMFTLLHVACTWTVDCQPLFIWTCNCVLYLPECSFNHDTAILWCCWTGSTSL